MRVMSCFPGQLLLRQGPVDVLSCICVQRRRGQGLQPAGVLQWAPGLLPPALNWPDELWANSASSGMEGQDGAGSEQSSEPVCCACPSQSRRYRLRRNSPRMHEQGLEVAVASCTSGRPGAWSALCKHERYLRLLGEPQQCLPRGCSALGFCSPPAPEVRLHGFAASLAKTTWRFHKWEKPF